MKSIVMLMTIPIASHFVHSSMSHHGVVLSSTSVTMALLVLCMLACLGARVTCTDIQTPHIVVITAEDIGWADISLHGSQLISTPNIDLMGLQGVVLQQYYSDCRGTSSMSAFYTGKYPINIGTQGPSIGAGEDRGVPTTEKLLSSYLKELGYSTHIVGKWQLGRSRLDYQPTRRGFDSFFGCTTDVDYLTYHHVETVNGTQYYGLDLSHNLEPVLNQTGHLTYVLTDRAVDIIKQHRTSSPLYLHVAHAAAHVDALVSLQATRHDIAANRHIAHPARRQYAAMVTGLDNSVGDIMAALTERNMLNNAIMIFMPHSGAGLMAEPRNYGSNLPMRGGAGTPFEGAVRSTALLWHANIKPNVWDGLFHVTDWLPTLVAAASPNKTSENFENLDGFDQWDAIINNEESKRHNAIIAVDDLNGWGAFRDGDFKIIVGDIPKTYGQFSQDLSKTVPNVKTPTYEETLMSSKTAKIFLGRLNIDINIDDVLKKRNSCNLKTQQLNLTIESQNLCVPTKRKGCLFNITADPEELQDLWHQYPDVVQPLNHHFRMLWSKLVPRRPVSFDPKADPQLHDYIWRPWVNETKNLPLIDIPAYPSEMSAEELKYIVNVNLNVVSEKLSEYMKSMTESLVESVTSIFGSRS